MVIVTYVVRDTKGGISFSQYTFLVPLHCSRTVRAQWHFTILVVMGIARPATENHSGMEENAENGAEPWAFGAYGPYELVQRANFSG
jgi:hypothetical protein